MPSRHPVAVVCSGVKSILDVPKTLEYLETKGVTVVSFQTDNFPTFYSNSAKIKSPNSCYTLQDLCGTLDFVESSGLNSGMVIANPVPQDAALDDEKVELIINEAMMEVQSLGIKGKEVTPFILEKVRQKTQGQSLEANLSLVYDNIKLACQVATVQAKRHVNTSKALHFSSPDSDPISKKPFPLIVGGINVDISIKAEAQLSAASNASRISLTLGGVGRNVAEVLNHLGTPPLLVSALGNDHMGKFARSILNFDHSNVQTSEILPTSVYTLVLQKDTSDLLYGFTQNEIHSSIDSETIIGLETKFQDAEIVVLDANIHENAARTVFELCKRYETPLLFEPTDYMGCQKVAKLFLDFPGICTFVTPNFKELYTLNETIISAKLNSQNIDTGKVDFSKCIALDSQITEENCLKLAEEYGSELLNFVDIALISFGPIGIVAASCNFTQSDLKSLSQLSQASHHRKDARFFLFQAHKCDSIVSCSGAGDSFVGGFLQQNVFSRKNIAESVAYGLICAYSSLLTTEAVNKDVRTVAEKFNWNNV